MTGHATEFLILDGGLNGTIPTEIGLLENLGKPWIYVEATLPLH